MTDHVRRGDTVVIQPLPGIGDMVWHVPHLRALAEMFGPLTVVTKARSQAQRLLAGEEWFDGYFILERGQGGHRALRHDGFFGLFRLAADLRKRGFQRAIVLHHSTRYVMSCRLARIPNVMSYGESLQRQLVTAGPVLQPPLRGRHPIDNANDYLAALGHPVADKAPSLRPTDTAHADVLKEFNNRPKPWFALGIGTSEPYKQWGEHNFARLATHFPEEGTVFIVGGPAEAEISDGLANRIGRPRATTAWHLPVDQTLALLKECEMLVANDTGALNLSAAVGTPSIGLFGAVPPMPGPTDIIRITPPDGQFDKEAGMNRISYGEVVETVKKLLGKAS